MTDAPINPAEAMARAAADRDASIKRARNASYRAIANGTADEIIAGLGVRHTEGPHWDTLRAQIHRAAVITENGPARSAAWGVFVTGLHEAEAAMANPANPNAASQEDRLYWRTKRRLLDLYCRYEIAPASWDLVNYSTPTETA